MKGGNETGGIESFVVERGSVCRLDQCKGEDECLESGLSGTHTYRLLI